MDQVGQYTHLFSDIQRHLRMGYHCCTHLLHFHSFNIVTTPTSIPTSPSERRYEWHWPILYEPAVQSCAHVRLILSGNEKSLLVLAATSPGDNACLQIGRICPQKVESSPWRPKKMATGVCFQTRLLNQKSRVASKFMIPWVEIIPQPRAGTPKKRAEGKEHLRAIRPCRIRGLTQTFGAGR
jgi:hypothetical protein